jgi:hypothetical protein
VDLVIKRLEKGVFLDELSVFAGLCRSVKSKATLPMVCPEAANESRSYRE